MFSELGRVLAGVGLLGHLPATFLLDRAGAADEALADGDTRAAFVPAKPPGDVDRAGPSTRARLHARRGAGGRRRRQRHRRGPVGARRARRRRARRRRRRTAARALVRRLRRDHRAGRRLRPDALARPRAFDGAPGTLLDVDPTSRGRLVPRPGAAGRRVAGRGRARARGLASSTPRSASRSGARSAPTRRSSTSSWRSCGGSRTPARSCTTRAGRARTSPRSSRSRRPRSGSSAGQALDHASRTQISVHGGIGATWEHDAPLYFRRAQLSRRLLAGTADAADRVAGELLTGRAKGAA